MQCAPSLPRRPRHVRTQDPVLGPSPRSQKKVEPRSINSLLDISRGIMRSFSARLCQAVKPIGVSVETSRLTATCSAQRTGPRRSWEDHHRGSLRRTTPVCPSARRHGRLVEACSRSSGSAQKFPEKYGVDEQIFDVPCQAEDEGRGRLT